MARLIDNIQEKDDVSQNDYIMISQNGAVKKVPLNLIGHDISADFVYSSGKECFRLFLNGETVVFMQPYGDVVSCELDQTNAVSCDTWVYDPNNASCEPSVSSITIKTYDTTGLEMLCVLTGDFIANNFVSSYIDNDRANDAASITITAKETSEYKGKLIKNFKINKADGMDVTLSYTDGDNYVSCTSNVSTAVTKYSTDQANWTNGSKWEHSGNDGQETVHFYATDANYTDSEEKTKTLSCITTYSAVQRGTGIAYGYDDMKIFEAGAQGVGYKLKRLRVYSTGWYNIEYVADNVWLCTSGYWKSVKTYSEVT